MKNNSENLSSEKLIKTTNLAQMETVSHDKQDFFCRSF